MNYNVGILKDIDSSILTNMGVLAAAGHYALGNLVHVALDNRMYENGLLED